MNPITTANKLKTLRNLKGLTPEQVAAKAQLNISDYNALENGKTVVQHDKLKKACDALGVDVNEWFETDRSNVFINNGEIKVDNGNGMNSCENCYFYQRNDDEMDMIKAVSLSLKAIVERLDEGWLSRDLEKFFLENKGKLKNEGE